MGKCKNCVNHGTTNCPESYREPTVDDTCDSFIDDGSLQGVKEFAEWLVASYIVSDVMGKRVWAEELMAEWQEETR